MRARESRARHSCARPGRRSSGLGRRSAAPAVGGPSARHCSRSAERRLELAGNAAVAARATHRRGSYLARAADSRSSARCASTCSTPAEHDAVCANRRRSGSRAAQRRQVRPTRSAMGRIARGRISGAAPRRSIASTRMAACTRAAGLTLANGLDWSPDGSTFYLVDTAALAVDAFDFDPTAARSPIAGR